MPGIKGMTSARPRAGAVRSKIWRSMRIFRRFNLPDLCRTTDAKVSNARKFVVSLAAHGYIAPLGGFVSGQPGSYQAWRLVDDCGPNYPMRCRRCGRPLGAPCEPHPDKEASDER